MKSLKYPIALMSFDRPNYLSQVLTALKQQHGDSLEERDIFLFQDGSKNPFSGRICADESSIQTCVSLFKSFFSNGTVFQSDFNLGIGLHFEKLENFLFLNQGYEAAIIMEDDFLPSPIYVMVLDRLIDQALQDSRIGCVSAVGDHALDREAQLAEFRRPIMMRQNWAFGMTRRQWSENKSIVDEYNSLIKGVDYRDRPDRSIFDLYSSLGVGRLESSQDRAKFIATTLNKKMRLSSTPCYGKYIGRVGIHSNELLYKQSGFEQTSICDRFLEGFSEISDDVYNRIMDEQFAHISPSPPVLWPLREMHFISGSEDCTSLGVGFYGPESDGTWMAGDTAIVRFAGCPELAETDWHFILGVKHFLLPGCPAGTVDVGINGTHVTTLQTLRTAQQLRFNVSGKLFKGRTVHELTLKGSPAEKPASASGRDERILSVALKSLLITQKVGNTMVEPQ